MEYRGLTTAADGSVGPPLSSNVRPLHLHLHGVHMKSNVLTCAVALSGCIALSSCAPAEPPQSGAAIANPASEYCAEEKGGRVEIVTDESGAQKGMCHLPDGTVVDEWELYRREHPQS